MTSLADLRKEYLQHRLLEKEASPSPFVQFQRWFDTAVKEGLSEPNAMTLATADKKGRPSARIVLLKDFGSRGFSFFTNYESRKAVELAANPHVALVFDWHDLERQINIEGRVEKLPRSISAAYFKKRPRSSQLGAWASHQSATVKDRAVLEKTLAALEKKFEGKEVPLPPFWGGYRVVPDTIHFWQGRANRLHDRLLYTRRGGKWVRTRLSP
jgi:pyridoxamine 5'-phosphate oxidase